MLQVAREGIVLPAEEALLVLPRGVVDKGPDATTLQAFRRSAAGAGC